MYSLFEQPLLFIDCQTTGATPARAHLLEVGWAVGRACDQAPPVVTTRLVALPEDQFLPPRIQKITGISQEDMANATALPLIVEQLQTALSENCLAFACAHWAQFEKSFLGDCFEKHAPNDAIDLQFVCTCQIAKKLYPALPSRAIRAVSGYFGLSVEEMKRSHGHVEATYFIWQKLVPDLDKAGVKNIGEIIEWLKPPPKIGGKRVITADKNLAKEAYLLRLERLTRLELPNQPGVYRMLNANGKILYVGKATSLKSRVNSYFTGRKNKDSKTKELISQVFDLNVSPLATPLEAALLENDLIKEHDPPYNRALKKRGRSLIYFDRQFCSWAPALDSRHILGPFPRGSTIEPLIILSQGLVSKKFEPALFWGLLDEESTNRAVTLFFDWYKDSFDLECQIWKQKASPQESSSSFVRSLLALGLSFYRRDLLDLLLEQKQKLDNQDDKNDGGALAKKSNVSTVSLSYFLGPQAGEAEEEELVEEDNNLAEQADEVLEELTDEELVQMVRSLITGAARSYCRARTLMRLLDATILYEEKNRQRKLVFERGHLVRSEDFTRSNNASLPQERLFKPAARSNNLIPIDLVTYDRMCVLLSEIRRLHGRGHWISLTAVDLVIS